ncbi:putative mitochondrial protein [Cucumis melo var. makuwa]|uniref:Mitochondrial protein n=1 Tax=Cucumis melo var. makuwa TaxID=1194695 RepID=A0A5A7U9Q8_CUCMM|nr:putative mitochondrial protein [Cucumis melo var. makuwa]TYK00698.1 putative mitochondrial protein [Cucumis melo var. makuwa]
MSDEFEIKDLEIMKYILGIEVTRSKEGSVSQRKYTLGLLTETGNLVILRSKKQGVVARSSAEVEYKAMSLGISINIGNNPVQHDRFNMIGTKHVEIDRHFIKERLDNGSICIPYISLSQQIGDVLTKVLLR